MEQFFLIVRSQIFIFTPYPKTLNIPEITLFGIIQGGFEDIRGFRCRVRN
jgi:hypothetical protein